MENVTFVEVENRDGSKDIYAIIDRGNEEFTSMLKSDYDEMIAKRETQVI
jgi:DNA-binding PadR family transcriptional regulator